MAASNSTIDIGTTVPVRQESFPGIGSMNGTLACLVGKVTMSNSYQTGGDNFDLTKYGAGPPNATSIYLVMFEDPNIAGVVSLRYDYTNKLILAYSSGSTEVSGNTDLHTLNTRFMALFASRG